MRSSEWIALLYFLYLATVCWLRPVPLPRRMLISGGSLLTLVAIVAVARGVPVVVRDWAPFVYVSIAYYLTGYLFVRPSAMLEAWLLKWDHRWLGDPTRAFARWPWWLIAWLDIIYVLCGPLLPGGFLLLVLTGHASQANRYWTMVLAADMAAFAPLLVFQTRPPWQIERPPALAASGVHSLASSIVKHATTGANTFPSGHVAVTLAVAFGVMSSLPVAGAVLLFCAASIAVACVVGRYHYTVDVLAGAALGLSVCAAVAAFAA